MKIVVAKDGSGDYATLQAAVDAIPESTSEEVTLFLRRGIYRERPVIHRDRVRLVGEDREAAVIAASGCAKDPDGNGAEMGTFRSATLMITGRDVTVENLTVRNDAGDGRLAGQAVAVYSAGDGGIFRNVTMLACQDTLFCGPLNPAVADFIAPRRGSAELVQVENLGSCTETRSRLYFENCFIRGDVDFIFGPYRCLFDRCTLYMNKRGGFYTAANTPVEQSLGMIFRDCALTGECDAGAGYLGRPWRKYARTLFLRCDMDECVSPLGFTDWDEERVVTDRLGEYGTTGARADLSSRHPAQRHLTAEEAESAVAEMLSLWGDHPSVSTRTLSPSGSSVPSSGRSSTTASV